MQSRFRLLPFIGAVSFFLLSASLAVNVVPDSNLPPESRCPDGRIPLNSLQVRCRNLPQLQWAGRKCDNGTNFSCPPGYNCLSNGQCCEVPETPKFQGDLCRLNPSSSNVIDVAGSCARDTDCKRQDSPMSKCCSGKCVHLMQRCFQKLHEYLSIQSTGKVPRQYMPICTYDGAFAPVQSEPRYDARWCVDRRTGLALRTGCCPEGRISTCANLRTCPRDLCAMQTCPAKPDARCRVNPCGGCRVEFLDSAGRPVDCWTGLSQCEAKGQNYYEGLAWLRARDQTQWVQTIHANIPVTSDAGLRAYMDTCQSDTCAPYNASQLEPTTSGGFNSMQRACPKQDKLGYRCPNRCKNYDGCKHQEVCCNSGCGLECMRPADISSEAKCSMSISSGHCPAVGCHRMCRRWGYDTGRRTCRPFWYAGSGGNNNRYNSWAECMWYVQNCHGRVLLALPVKPLCKRDGYNNVQMTDNGMHWCVNSEGVPTPGTLHADDIRCTSSGKLILNKYYKKVSYLYKARCPNGNWPAWCHNLPANKSCGSPGISTFADACNGCHLVHVNANGEEVACQSDEEACKASGRDCDTPTSTSSFSYSVSTGRCDPVRASDKCSAGGSYSREAGCLQACATGGWCQTTPAAFYPDLCVSPTCDRWPNAVCVPDECAGRERYLLPNGTEVVGCARQLEALSVAREAGCGGAASSSISPDSATTTRSTGETTRPNIASTTRQSTSNRSSTRAAATAQHTTFSTSTTVFVDWFTMKSTTKPTVEPTAKPTVEPTAKTTSKLELTTSKPLPKTVLAICRIRSHLGVEPYRCRVSDGKYEPRQCNATHCFCVVIDSGALVTNAPVVALANVSSLSCPVVETINLTLSIRYDGNYMSVLPTMEDEDLLQKIVIRKFAYEGGLQTGHIRTVDLEPGSIIVSVGFEKTPGDATADLPAASFELKTMALKETLTLDFNGVTLAPSAQQDFNENSGSSVLEEPTNKLTAGGDDANTAGAAAELNVVGIVAGVLITVVVLAVAGVIIAFALRRRSLLGEAALPHESGDYETMSNASQSTGPSAYDNFANKVYAPVEDVYDNIAQPASSA